MNSINVGFANGAEIDLKIDENFKEDDLVKFLQNYAEHQEGIGGNILTCKYQMLTLTLLLRVKRASSGNVCFGLRCTNKVTKDQTPK